MILDVLAQSAKYESLHPGFAPAFAHLRSAYAKCLEEHIVPDLGRHALDGERLQVIFERGVGRGDGGTDLEVHRRYIDIQFLFWDPDIAQADELIGWKSLSDCTKPIGAFNDQRDIQFYNDHELMWLRLMPGSFMIFYPTDAHAPLQGEGPVLKAIYKVAVDW